MSTILIVSRTKMRNGVCVGGVDINSGSFVRLHTSTGANLAESAPYQIGQIWNFTLEEPWNARPRPHVEDMMVKDERLVRTISSGNLSNYIQSLNVPITRGSLTDVFGRALNFTSGGKGYINHDNVPGNSVAFWITDAVIRPVTKFGKLVFEYKNYNFPYVGFSEPTIIPAGTLVRLSLANWWQPDDADIEERCYLQLSGWYE